MQKFSCKLFLLTILLVFGFAITAQAVPYMIPDDSPIYFQFNNMEQVDQTGSNSIVMPGINPLTSNSYDSDLGRTVGNWGVFNISSIQQGAVSTPNQDISGGTPLWVDTLSDNGQIHGIFTDIQLTSGTTATGGFMDIYWSDNATTSTIDSADLNGDAPPDAATVGMFTEGTFLARLNFASGIITNDFNTTIESSQSLFGTLTGPGNADSFANVDTSVTGLWTDRLDGDWFNVHNDTETRDVRFSNFFNTNTKWDGTPAPVYDNDDNLITPGIAGLRSNDPGRVYTAVIPEPGTIFLLGAGLLGFAGVMRRKSS